jgi:hypothetical protein
MLRSLPSIDLLKHELRRRVCSKCHLRPPNSERIGAEVVRPCEVSCPAFVHLPVLRRVAALQDPLVGSRAEALGKKIDQISAHQRQASCRRSPLGLYRDEIIRAVVDLVDDV